MADEAVIQQAVGAANAGDQAAARQLLMQVLRADPHSARAWYLLSQVVEQKERQIYCLEKTLELQPDLAAAQNRLRALRGEPGAEPEGPAAAPVQTAPVAPATDPRPAPAPAAPAVLAAEAAPQPARSVKPLPELPNPEDRATKDAVQTVRVLTGVAALLAVFCLGCLGLFAIYLRSGPPDCTPDQRAEYWQMFEPVFREFMLALEGVTSERIPLTTGMAQLRDIDARAKALEPPQCKQAFNLHNDFLTLIRAVIEAYEAPENGGPLYMQQKENELREAIFSFTLKMELFQAEQ